MNAVSKMYGHFFPLNSLVISNTKIFDLVQKYIALMMIHHATVLTMLNVDRKVKNKYTTIL